MKSYARVDGGVYVELISPMAYEDESPYWVEGDPSRIGDEIPIELRFTPEFISWLVEITDMNPEPQLGWVHIDGGFAPWTPSAEQVLAEQSNKLQGLTQLTNSQKLTLVNRISTLQDAVDNIGIEGLEEFAATAEEQVELPKRKSQLTKWKNYGILLGRVTSQTGWPPNVTWPTQPTEGMDLTVSGTTSPSV